jgi:hypothetical protein
MGSPGAIVGLVSEGSVVITWPVQILIRARTDLLHTTGSGGT